jgi:hypothetical protein
MSELREDLLKVKEIEQLNNGYLNKIDIDDLNGMFQFRRILFIITFCVFRNSLESRTIYSLLNIKSNK